MMYGKYDQGEKIGRWSEYYQYRRQRKKKHNFPRVAGMKPSIPSYSGSGTIKENSSTTIPKIRALRAKWMIKTEPEGGIKEIFPNFGIISYPSRCLYPHAFFSFGFPFFTKTDLAGGCALCPANCSILFNILANCPECQLRRLRRYSHFGGHSGV